MATASEIALISTGTRVQLTTGLGGITAGSNILNGTDCQAYKSIEFQLVGLPIGAGVVQVQQSHDATFATYEVVLAKKISGNSYNAIGANPAGQYTVPVLAKHVKITVSAPYTGGTLTGVVWGSTADRADNLNLSTSTLASVTTVTTVAAVTAITNALPTGTNTIGNTNQTLATAEFAKITDGTNTSSVKAPNSLPTTLTDSAVVVSQRDAIPAGTNKIGQVTIDQTTQGTTNFVTTNSTQVAGNTVATGVGVSNTGTQRVAVAHDSKVIPWDGTNNIVIKGASTAAVAADPALTVTLSPNTATVPTQDLADGPVAPGAAANKSQLIGGQFNTTLPTLTNSQQSAIQLDASGRQIVAPLTNTSIVKAQLQDNAGSAVVLGQAAMAASLPVTIASNQSSLPVRLGVTDYVQSSGNNTLIQLASSAIFTGTIESALNHPQVLISVRSDQPITITVKQYSDLLGTIAYPDIVYTRTANQGFNQAITLNASYYRVVVQNTGATLTTNFFLETWLGILAPAPNLTNLGNFPVAIVEGSSGGGGSTQLFRASGLGTGYATNDLLEFNGTAWRNITNPAAITTLVSPPTAGSIFPVVGGIVTNNGTVTDGSGTITLGGTAQTLLATNTNRQGWRIQNTSADNLFINDLGATATTSSYRVASGAEYNPPYSTTAAISILGNTTGQTFTAQQWNTPSTSGTTLFVQPGTPNGQQLSTASYPIVPASDYSETTYKDWKVFVATGTPVANVGETLRQLIKVTGSTVIVTWINLNTGVRLTVTPTLANLFDLEAPLTACGRQEFALWTPTTVTLSGNTVQASNVYSIRVGTASITTANSTFTVPAGKRLRLTQLNWGVFQASSITANNDGIVEMSVVYDYGLAPISSSAKAIAATGVWGWIPPATAANNKAVTGHAEVVDESIDLASGAVIGIMHLGVNWSGSSHNLSLKGYLYNN